jgi:hypothetical protein
MRPLNAERRRNQLLRRSSEIDYYGAILLVGADPATERASRQFVNRGGGDS